MGLIDPTMEGFLWVLAISLSVILLDIFFNTEVLSAIALLAVSFYLAAMIDVDLKWQIIITLACWLVTCLLFFGLARKLMLPLVKKIIPEGEKESIHKAIGSTAEFRLIDDKSLVYWNSDLWPVEDDENSFKDHEKVMIKSVKNGIFTITKGEE